MKYDGDNCRLSHKNLKARKGRQNRRYAGETNGSVVISSGKIGNEIV
jgi:hypothetical protein